MEDDRRDLRNPYAPPTSALEAAPPNEPARVVVYRYALSVIFFTYYGHSEPIAVMPGSNDWRRGLPYTLVSLLFGWWGLPWGPIRTIQAIFVNFTGGQDITSEQNRRVYRVEEPDAKWACPKCGRSNSNLRFDCVCGYRLV